MYLFYLNCTPSVVLHLDVHVHEGVGQQGGDVFRPFDEAQASAVEVFLRAEVEGFLHAVDAVAVEVVDGAPVGGFVLVDDGEGGAVHRVLHAQYVADGADEGGFAGSHGAVEGEHAAVAHEADEAAGRFADGVEGCDFECGHSF